MTNALLHPALAATPICQPDKRELDAQEAYFLFAVYQDKEDVAELMGISSEEVGELISHFAQLSNQS
uniref:hypothetical protein n=1 Tax=Thaumasiovibrio occultus TaxID=1891184 RepID=UPI000B354BE3|nr:hypothetical protein [Thaumasiovibrio occultus]